MTDMKTLEKEEANLCQTKGKKHVSFAPDSEKESRVVKNLKEKKNKGKNREEKRVELSGDGREKLD